MKTLFTILFFTVSYILQANNHMKRCYEKNTIEYRITMDFTTDLNANLAIWEIHVHLPDENILLDKCVSNQLYIEELRNTEEACKHVIIGDAIVIGQDVYIMMTRLDSICLMRYHLLPVEKQVVRSTHYIEEDEVVIYNLFGPRYFTATFKSFSQNQLWVTWNESRLLWFDCVKEEGFQIEFDREVEKISGIIPDNLDGNSAEIAVELKRVLNYPPDKKNDIFQYIGYLDETGVLSAMRHWDGKRGDGITYFFYKKEKHYPLKVIRYHNYRKKWLYSGYKEEKIPINTIADIRR